MGWGRARRVEIGRDADGAIFTLGDNSPIIVRQGDRDIFAVSPLTEPPAVPAGSGPASLLASRHELVQFVGRDDLRRDVTEWLATAERRAVRLLVGPGGQGKSRFALRAARDAAAAGWRVFVARHEVDGGLLLVDDPLEPLVVPTEPVGVLVLVDYADRWPPQDLLHLLLQRDAQGERVRMLLLGRSGAFWPTFIRSLQQAGIAVSRRTLEPLPDSQDTRTAMFAAAEHAFATALAVPLPADRMVADLSAEEFGLTLAVHMAALVAVLRHRDHQAGRPVVDEPALDDPAALSRELLVREVDHWDKMTRRRVRPVRLTREEMARAVFTAILTRGLSVEAALELLPPLPLGAAAQEVIDDHALCYPPTSSNVLEPLYPDRLGEDFVAALLPGAPPDHHDTAPLDFLADPIAPTILNRLIDDAVRYSPIAVPVVTMLVETARRWPHVAERNLAPIVARPDSPLLTCYGTVIERAATIPALAPLLPDLGAALDRVIGAGSHLRLDVGAAAVQQQLVTQTREDGDSAALADALHGLGVRLASVGRRTEALTAAREAVTHYRELTALNRDAHLPNLAVSVTNLALRLAENGHRTEALTTAHEATNVHRELTALNRDAHLPNLAVSVNNLALRLAENGHRTEALAAAREAVTLRRELTALNRDAHLPNLATSVDNLAVRLAENGHRTEALTTAREAVTLSRELTALNRDAHLPRLAASVNNLAPYLAENGHRTEALAAAREAVTLRRELTALNPGVHLPDLAASVDNLALYLAENGHRTEALTTAQEATTYYRELTALNPGAHLPDLAASVNNLANHLAENGHRTEALTTATEATALRRELTARNRDAHLPDLAASVNNLAVRLGRVGRRAEALTTAEEAVTLYRELTIRNRDAHLPNLAASVNNLANRLASAGRRAEALTTAQEATTLYRELITLNRDAHLPNLAMSVNNLALRLVENGRRAEALTTVDEALAYRRELAEKWPGVFADTVAESERVLAWLQAAD